MTTHLCQILPKLTQIVKDLSVDLWVFDAIHIPQDTQHPPPHHRGNICVPSSQRAACHHTAVLTGELAGLYNQSANWSAFLRNQPQEEKKKKKPNRIGCTHWRVSPRSSGVCRTELWSFWSSCRCVRECECAWSAVSVAGEGVWEREPPRECMGDALSEPGQ